MRAEHTVIWALAGWLFLVAAAAGQLPPEMSVHIRTAYLRGNPSYLGRVTGDLPYGARVRVLAGRGAWIQVQDAGGATGWLHQTALTPKRVVFRADRGEVRTSTTDDELAMAGKGFSQSVESAYRTRNRGQDFRWVDWMEQAEVPSSELLRFLREGGLVQQEGRP